MRFYTPFLNWAAYFIGCFLRWFTQEGGITVDYKKAYFELYGEIADLIERMQEIQRKYEEKYISEEDRQENN